MSMNEYKTYKKKAQHSIYERKSEKFSKK